MQNDRSRTNGVDDPAAPGRSDPPDADLLDPGRPDHAIPSRPVRSLEQASADSALLHAIRASSLSLQLQHADRRPAGARARTLSLPIARVRHRAAFVALLARRTARALSEDGPAGTLARARSRLTGRPHAIPPPVPNRPDPEPGAARPPAAPPLPAAATLLAHRVLIAAELSIPQCAKYRVWQKAAAFVSTGTPCTVIDWRRTHDVRSALQTHTLLILYRVPAFPDILSLLEEARRLGVPTAWEVDDLIFDTSIYARNSNLRSLPAAQQTSLLTGASLYWQAMLAADRSIASTGTLARLMTAATGKPCDIVQNGLDLETLRHAGRRPTPDASEDGIVRIVYGSGTKTHDADFALAASALRALMSKNPELRLRIVGELELGLELASFSDRIERFERTHFEEYLRLVQACDIAIAPLEPGAFNDAKSNIKLVEASILGLPSVCSPRATFREAITDGEDGYLAETEADWLDRLQRLVSDPSLRTRIAAASRRRILALYDPARIARDEVAPIAARLPERIRRRRRILVVNVFFSPRSFGGATLIAEELAVRHAADPDTEIFVFTTRAEGAPYTLERETARGLATFYVSAPGAADEILSFDDPEMARAFGDVLEAVGPDLVHFHSIQTLGAAMVRLCQVRSVPYVVTLHDAWWLCPRQFMVTAANVYCNQSAIDLKVCEACVPGAAHLGARLDILLQALHGADLVLSPSRSHAALYAANGIPPARLRVNRNGVRAPQPRPRTHPGPARRLRFGYVGGNERLKGIGVIRAAFETVPHADWELVLVDNLLNLGPGLHAFDPADWALRGTVRIVPAYRRDTADAFFAGIDVLLFPSQWKESFGLTVREALVRDVWVIATDCGGGSEDIAEGVNGTIIPMGNDPAPLRDAIAELLAHPERARDLVNPFKDRIVTLDAQADELSAHYDAVLAGRSDRARSGV